LVLEDAWDFSLQLAAARRAGDRRSRVGAETRLVDEKFLKSSLNLGNRAWVDGLLGVGCSDRSLRSSRGSWRSIGSEGGLLFNYRADWTGLLVFDGGGLWSNWLLIFDSDLETKLELSLRSSIELLVDRRIVRVEDDECSSTIGITFEDGFGGRWDCKEESKLEKEDLSASDSPSI
jgi:hypothetical protein